MKVLHISTYATGGAANAAIRLHLGLLKQGVDSHFLSLYGTDSEIPSHSVFLSESKYGLNIKKRISGKLRLTRTNEQKRTDDYKSIRQEIECFSSPTTDYKLGAYVKEHFECDIINLHWVANFLDYREFFHDLDKPVIWTLHDEQAFSSYWHYSNDFVDSVSSKKIHAAYLENKRNALSMHKNAMGIVSPSLWLLRNSMTSDLFSKLEHHHIPYGINTEIFKERNTSPIAIIESGASSKFVHGLFICQNIKNTRKGMLILAQAISLLPDDVNLRLIAVGESDEAIRSTLPKNTIYTGTVQDENELARLYSFADFTIIPSLQDNLPNTVLESICCGTPVIGTPAGGIPEAISSEMLGRIAKNFSAKSLCLEIKSLLESVSTINKSDIANSSLTRYTLSIQAVKYIKIYCALLKSNST